MIGVVAPSDQQAAVEEFFELFKTPWEIHQPGRCYDVVIVTTDEIPRTSARLLVIYSAQRSPIDSAAGAVPAAYVSGAFVHCDGVSLPIYGRMATFAAGSRGTIGTTSANGVAALRFDGQDSTIIRVGYNLFDEVRRLLTDGQPTQYAEIPTLDLHIRMLRSWIVDAGVSFVEIPPAPAGFDFTVCLTHDIDFAGVRRHFLDHTMWGFLYRSTIGALWRSLRRRLSVTGLLTCWRAAVSLPFVYLGWARDFWDPFQWYLTVENNLPATYFLIPFKRRAGDRVAAAHARRRAAPYDVTDVADSVKTLVEQGCEIGVHGIDAWHDTGKGIVERSRVADVTGQPSAGIRMHWLLSDARTAAVLDQAGYSYDATSGYNQTLGYRNGTTQAFRPFTASTLLELPLHIQDGALFYPNNLDLSDDQATVRCRALVEHAKSSGGALTLLWHDRSHAPERLWGDFYLNLLRMLRSSNAWFATASQAVDWFRARRHVRFERLDGGRGADVAIRYEGKTIQPPLRLKHHDKAIAS